MPTGESREPMARLQVKELGSKTWPDFVRIMEKHNDVWGSCWCITFHLKSESDPSTRPHRAYK